MERRNPRRDARPYLILVGGFAAGMILAPFVILLMVVAIAYVVGS